MTSPPSADPQTPTSASQPRRPLQREGATIFLSLAEQALQDAMLRSSPIPEVVLGKRTRQEGDDADSGNELDATPPPTQPQLSLPSISNVTAAALRYAAHKKLRPEQRDELEAFLLVSGCFFGESCLRYHSGHRARPTSQVVHLYFINWEQGRRVPIRGATLPGIWRVESMALSWCQLRGS